MKTQNLKDSSLLKILNIIAIIIDIIAIVFILNSQIRVDPTIVIFVHSTFLVWSVIYHLLPTLRENAAYRFLSQTSCNIILMLTILNIFGAVVSTDWGFVIFILLLLCYTGPCSLVAITLLLLLNNDTPSKAEEVQSQQMIYIPVSNAQLFVNPVHKML